MLTIYHMPGSRSTRVVWAAEELGLPYELVIRQRAELKHPEFLAINPLGSAPAIRDGDVTMIESSAIVEYLVERHDIGGHLAPPVRSPLRAAYFQWLHFPEASLMPPITSFILASGRFGGTPPDQPAMQAALHKVAGMLGYIDVALSDGPFITGERFSGADIALYWCLKIGRDFDAVDQAHSPNVRLYLDRLESRSSLRKAMEIPAGFVNQPPRSIQIME